MEFPGDRYAKSPRKVLSSLLPSFVVFDTFRSIFRYFSLQFLFKQFFLVSEILKYVSYLKIFFYNLKIISRDSHRKWVMEVYYYPGAVGFSEWHKIGRRTERQLRLKPASSFLFSIDDQPDKTKFYLFSIQNSF